MRHLEVRQKYSAACRIFNSLLGVSSGDGTLHLMLDILHQILRCWCVWPYFLLSRIFILQCPDKGSKFFFWTSAWPWSRTYKKVKFTFGGVQNLYNWKQETGNDCDVISGHSVSTASKFPGRFLLAAKQNILEWCHNDCAVFIFTGSKISRYSGKNNRYRNFCCPYQDTV